MTTTTMLALSLFAMALLTFTVVLLLGAKRVALAKDPDFDMRYYRLYRGDSEPDDVRQTSRNLVNLFEMPVLFYLGVLLALVLHLESMTLVALAWTFVAARYSHSFVHIVGNRVKIRFLLYASSLLVLAAYWVVLLVGLLSA